MNDDVIEVSTVHSWTRRKKMLLLASFVSVVLVLITIAGALMPEESYAINYGNKYAEPSLQYIFGTDHMGRDMLYRCIKGLSISIQVGLLAAFVSSCIALVLGTLSATFGGKVDAFILWLVDLCMGVPHIFANPHDFCVLRGRNERYCHRCGGDTLDSLNTIDTGRGHATS